MELRRFNNKGIETFREALAICREDPKSDISTDLLTNSEFTDVHSPKLDVDLISFATKREAAVYLNKHSERSRIRKVSKGIRCRDQGRAWKRKRSGGHSW